MSAKYNKNNKYFAKIDRILQKTKHYVKINHYNKDLTKQLLQKRNKNNAFIVSATVNRTV